MTGKTYFERGWPLAATFVRRDIRESAPTSDGCFVLCEGESKAGAYFRNVELFKSADDHSAVHRE